MPSPLPVALPSLRGLRVNTGHWPGPRPGSSCRGGARPLPSCRPPFPLGSVRVARGIKAHAPCALTLSVITGGFRMDWDPAAPTFLRNHPSSLAEAAFVAEAIAAGIAARTMRACSRDELICILPLGVAFNSALKRRLIWDGRHVNRHLRKRPFRVETLQREGRALFERSSFGGTLNISSAYMAPEAFPYLGFEWEGCFFCFEVLPFGLSSAPWLFTTVMGHSFKFLRYEEKRPDRLLRRRALRVRLGP
jgi:hypothetical protein